MLATLLICLGTVLLFVVVCAFASNQQLHDGVTELPYNTRNGLEDMKEFLRFTGDQFDTLLSVNYDEFASNFLTTINNSSEIVYEQLKEFTHAVIMTNISNFAGRLDEIKTGFRQIKYSTNSLRVYASQLNDATRKVKKDLLQTLEDCAKLSSYKSKCEEIKRNVSHFGTQIDFNELPDITEEIKYLDQYDNDINELHISINKGNDALMKVEGEIQKSLSSTLDQVRSKVAETNRSILENLHSVKTRLKQSQEDIKEVKPYLDTMDKYIKEYGKYHYYVGLGISCVLLLISLLIMLGLICGICGKRPEVYGDDCCNKGAGSQFLICGVMIMFICGFVFSLIILPTFLLGVTSQRVVCDSIRNPNDSHIISLIDQVLNTQHKTTFKYFSVASVLIDVQQNKSLYKVFKLEEQFDLGRLRSYLEDYNKTLSDLHSKLSGASNYMKTIRLNESIPYLKKMADLKVDVNFDKFEEELNGNFTNVNLTVLSAELGSLIEQISDAPDLQNELRLSKLHIDSYQEKIVTPMTKNASKLIELCRNLKKDLSSDHGSFKNEVDALVINLQGAQENIQDGQETLQNITIDFANSMVNRVRGYIERVIDKTENDIGRTGPFAQAINGTLTSTCDKILLPFNGFWFVMFWSIIIFIPTIIVSVKLATLYQKYSPYSGHLVETEYLYDAYADRDSIPLSSGARSKHRKKKTKKNKYEERGLPNGSGDMVTREFPGASHQDARYADMAPKHWEDFPAGGPPQYQRAPTEYERPPPYYYPGTGDHQ